MESGARRRPRLFALASVGAGVAAALAHPPWGLLPGLLGYAVMVWLADHAAPVRPLRSAFLHGWLAGCGYFAVSLHWLIYPFFVDARNQAWMAPFAVVILVAGMALFWGAAMSLYRAMAARGPRRVLLFAGLLALFEWLRGHVLTGFPWDLPGETWAAGSAPSQAAALIGAYGLTWLTLAIFSAAAVAFGNGLGGKAVAAAGAAGLAALIGYGAVRLANAAPPNSRAPWVRVVQPDVPQAANYDEAMFDHILSRYLAFTARRSARRPDIIVWPEGAIPDALEDYLAPGAWTARAIGDAVGPGRALILGGYRFAGEAAGRSIAYNTLVVLRPAPGGVRVVGLYDKYRLVPFGEYIPLDSLASRLGIKELVHVGDGFSPGPPPRPLSTAGLPPMQPLICYEVLFPGFTAQSVAASGVRPAWIVNISTDAWFGAGAGPLQHLNIARYRAIEEGLPMVRATPTGVSAVIDAYGRIRPGNSLGEGAAGIIDARLPPPLAPTPFSRWGDGPFWLMLTLSLAGAAWPFRRSGAPR